MNCPLQSSEHSHNPEKGLMDLVERYVLASNGWENALCTNENFLEAKNEFEETRAKIQKIADDYERTKQERDKLLEALKDCRSGLVYIKEYHGELYGVGFDRCIGYNQLIAECEDK